MKIDLNDVEILVMNAFGMPAVQMIWAFVFSKIPLRYFGSPVDKPASGSGGRDWFFLRILRIRKWKDRLPDAGKWFSGGFSKRRLADRSSGHLGDFSRETWRSEICHETAMISSLLFSLWNPPWAATTMVLAFIGANLPFVLVQRYNRRRIARILQKRLCQRRALARSAAS